MTAARFMAIVVLAASIFAPAGARAADQGNASGMMGGGMMGGGMMGGGMMSGGMMASPARNHQAMHGGIPAPYASMRNPLPNSTATRKRGAAVYAQNCATCHGATGEGDGEAGKALSPPPANLVWFARMPMSRWDPFMYWTVAEGGKPFGTAMPAFKDAMRADDIWAAISFVQHQLGGPK